MDVVFKAETLAYLTAKVLMDYLLHLKFVWKGKMIKVFKGFRNPKKGGQRHFFKKTLGNYQGVGI